MGTAASTAATSTTSTTLRVPVGPAEKATDATFHVSDLLKRVPSDSEILQYDPNLSHVTARRENLDVPHAFVVHDLLSVPECEYFIKLSENIGYAPSPLTILGGDFQHSRITDETRQVRDSSRVLCDMPPSLVEPMAGRLSPHLPKEVVVDRVLWKLKEAGPINERWRFNKYARGQKFAPHFDAGFARSVNESTHMTLIVYLNEGFEGGETIFYPGGKKHGWEEPSVAEVVVVPKPGLALVFMHNGEFSPRHEGAPHRTEGQFKYIIRSDIVFTRAEPLALRPTASPTTPPQDPDQY